MNQTKKWLALLAAGVLMLGALSGCTKEPGDDSSAILGGETEVPTYDNGVKTVYEEQDYGFQLEKPVAGDTVAILHTSKGDISIRLFPEAAPKAVENFTTHAKNGYYNGLTFHRVMEDFMVQGGDPKGNGTGGESIWGEKGFVDEFDKKLLNLRGSLAMANSGVNTNGSQFFINQAGPQEGVTGAKMKENYMETCRSYAEGYNQFMYMYGEQVLETWPTVYDFMQAQSGFSIMPTTVPDEVWDLYARIGGNLHLDGGYRYIGGHTVFGQVYEGMDVVDAIAAVEVDSASKPLTDVTITSIEIIEYKG